MTIWSLERLGREGREGLCPATTGFSGTGIPAEDMRIKGQEGPDKEGGGVEPPEQMRLYQVSLKHCTKSRAALTTATGPDPAALTATSRWRLCVDVWPQLRPHYVGSCPQSLDRGLTLSPSPSTWSPGGWGYLPICFPTNNRYRESSGCRRAPEYPWYLVRPPQESSSPPNSGEHAQESLPSMPSPGDLRASGGQNAPTLPSCSHPRPWNLWMWPYVAKETWQMWLS